MRRAISGVTLALLASGCLLSGCAADSDAATGQPAPSGSASKGASDLQQGDCVRMVQDPDSPEQYIEIADCAKSHHGEVVLAQDDFFGDWHDFPSEEQIASAAQTACDKAMFEYSGVKASNPGIRMSYLFPTQATWQEDDRKLRCVAFAYDSNLDSLVEISGTMSKTGPAGSSEAPSGGAG